MATIASCIPFNDINARFATDSKVEESTVSEATLKGMAYIFWLRFQKEHGNNPESFVKEYSRIEPFSLYKQSSVILEEVTNVK